MADGYSKEDGPGEAPPGMMGGLIYCDALTEVTGRARNILEKWSDVPASEVVEHVNEMRDRAYKVFPWPSIGLYQFLSIYMLDFDCYPEILESIKKGAFFLDLGCCFAQEVRQVILDGAPPANVFGADLSSDFMNLGYDLFLDQDKLGARFIQSDIFDDQSALRTEFHGRLDVIHASNFFHVWEWGKTIEAAKHAVSLLSSKPGSVILGTQVGTKRARKVIFPHMKGRSAFFQNPTTWKRLWDVVQQDMGIQLDVQVTESYIPDKDEFQWPEELEFTRLHFVITRVS
ncbi:hypothetical protein N7494_011687 [Penicillium frequentans]|uniref:Methyltransferase domain-containing protein n=1 Tax=Penicillium frequentans TaxID=3151616 RepID=A0AAD6GAD7_9EURO|nr:hypothetical protein N7494_011687 [Penicillium glabrum]